MFQESVELRLPQTTRWLLQPAHWLRSRLRRVRRFLTPFTIRHAVDLLICTAALPVLLPIMGVIALAVMADSGRPVLFIQDRIGRGGKRFRMFKFRTLRKDYRDSSDRQFMKEYIQGRINHNNGADKPVIHKPFQTSQMTRLGRLLRRTSLDEIPQIFNVLLGEMSLVGPRPNVIWEVEAYHGWHTERLEVLPGITGLAQVRGRSGLAFDELARHDIEYVRNKCLWLDLKIMWWTVSSILSGRGAG